MPSWKWLLVFFTTGYLALVALMYVAQRGLMYFPETLRTAPADAGLAEAEEVTLDTPDGERVIVWHIPPRGDGPVWLYFHGNGGALRYRVDRFRELTAQGEGLVALSYRGYAGSTGRPSEAGLIADARAAYDFAAKRYGAERIVLWGESLGSGVALALAAEQPVARIVLEAPFLSAMDIAQGAYPFVPVRFLMKDTFRSDERIAQVTVPVLILHGARDRIIPIRFGERLHELVRGPKQFIRLPEAEHNDHEQFGATEMLRPFILGQGL